MVYIHSLFMVSMKLLSGKSILVLFCMTYLIQLVDFTDHIMNLSQINFNKSLYMGYGV